MQDRKVQSTSVLLATIVDHAFIRLIEIRLHRFLKVDFKTYVHS